MNKQFMLTTIALAYQSHMASAAIVQDGIWTGNDWYDDVNEIGVNNGVPYSNNPSV